VRSKSQDRTSTAGRGQTNSAMQNRFFRPLLAFAALSMCLYLAREAARKNIPSVRYESFAEFESMPADDTALEEWLRNEPGVLPRSAYVDRQQNALRITWSMSRDVLDTRRVQTFSETLVAWDTTA
jgi:hypothetical protein